MEVLYQKFDRFSHISYNSPFMTEQGTNSSITEQPVSPEFMDILTRHLLVWSRKIGSYAEVLRTNPYRKKRSGIISDSLDV